VEREELLADYRQLTQAIKLRNLIIACFIPPAYQDVIMSHCHWLEPEQSWHIDFAEHAGGWYWGAVLRWLGGREQSSAAR
jgi:kinesin family protein 3/17